MTHVNPLPLNEQRRMRPNGTRRYKINPNTGKKKYTSHHKYQGTQRCNAAKVVQYRDDIKGRQPGKAKSK